MSRATESGMKKALVAIGVNKTGALPTLRAAARGAVELGNWGAAHGFDVTVLADSSGNPVRAVDVRAAIEGIVKKRVYDQLIVYFSGHGILKAADFEVWLLSRAPGDANEAVNVPLSILLARNSRIPHLVVISDACRSLPTDPIFGGVYGGVIFPNERAAHPRPDVDVFYATLPGDPSLELPPMVAALEHRGIFSDCMLGALSGREPTVIKPLDGTPGSKRVIPSRPMKKYLELAVPLAVGRVSPVLNQYPEIRVESDLPQYLTEVSAAASGAVPPPTPLSDVDRAPASLARVAASVGAEVFQRGRADYELPPTEGPNAARFRASMERILAVSGRESFETRTGFTVSGAEVREAKSSAGECDVFDEAGNVQVRVRIDERRPARLLDASSIAPTTFLRFHEGHGTALATLPGYIGTVLVEAGRVVSVNYTPSRNTPRYSEYQARAPELNRRRAYAAVAARNGVFTLSKSAAGRGAGYLRMLKALDPTLGLYAAYAYLQAGDFESIDSVLEYMRRDVRTVPFDVLLLAQHPYREHGDRWNFEQSPPHLRMPLMPVLTQGWAFLDSIAEFLPLSIFELRAHLVPALWTTFSPRGIDILEQSFDWIARPR